MSDIISLLMRHEGLRLKPYKDSEEKTTIGFGRNLDDIGITAGEADLLLRNDVLRCTYEALSNFDWYKGLDPVRKDVIISMIFNMGLAGFLGFRKMIQAIQVSDFESASNEMLDSRWSKQVASRAHELSEMMRTGNYLIQGGDKNGNS